MSDWTVFGIGQSAASHLEEMPALETPFFYLNHVDELRQMA
jgi:hypothetical protein